MVPLVDEVARQTNTLLCCYNWSFFPDVCVKVLMMMHAETRTPSDPMVSDDKKGSVCTRRISHQPYNGFCLS